MGSVNTLELKYIYTGILIQAYAPLGSPSRRGVQATDPVVMEDPMIKEMAVKKSLTPAQVAS